jgi:predicted ArsR family transcriptional regulator
MRFNEFTELIRPQWRAVLEQLKLGGGMAVTEIAAGVGASYMGVKQHCEELHKLGYLDRTRVPRTEVGRPEIFYSLSEKAAALFPEVGVDFTLELLAELKGLFGESTPDKLLFQYFQKLELKWQAALAKAGTIRARAEKLVTLREQFGGTVSLSVGGGGDLCLEEFHNPLQRIFERYPRAAAMELRMIEQLLGARVTRREVSSGRGAQPRVVFEIYGAMASG